MNIKKRLFFFLEVVGFSQQDEQQGNMTQVPVIVVHDENNDTKPTELDEPPPPYSEVSKNPDNFDDSLQQYNAETLIEGEKKKKKSPKRINKKC